MNIIQILPFLQFSTLILHLNSSLCFCSQHLIIRSSNSLRSCLPLCSPCSLCILNSCEQQRKAAVQHHEGVNDLWSVPAADVGGMEVNRDEVFSIEPQLTWQTPLMLPSVLGHFFSGYNRTGSFPFLKLTLLSLPYTISTVYEALSMP